MMPSIGHAALIVAAGKGTRFGKGTEPKQYYVINGRALLCHAALCLINHPRIDYVQVVIHPDDRALYDEAMADVSLPPPVDGGATRQQSVHHGLEALHHLNPASVLVHDSARPIVPSAVIDRLLDALTHHDAAIPCLPIHDTVKEHHNNDMSPPPSTESIWCACKHRKLFPIPYCSIVIATPHTPSPMMPPCWSKAKQRLPLWMEVAIV